jgi:hypothetical protein
MCLGPVAAGIATAVTSAISTVAGFVAQQQQTAFANAQAQQQYQTQLAAFKQSEIAFNEQIRLNAEAANRAYMAEQDKLNFERQKAAMEAQKLMISSMQAQGSIFASGRSGQSIGLLANDATREYSRDLATLGLSLGYAYQDYYSGTEGIFNQAQTANNMAQSNRMLEPSKPIKAPSPSPLGLIGGLAGAGLQGFSTFSSLKAPSGSSVPRPVPVSGAQLPGGRAGTVINWQ